MRYMIASAALVVCLLAGGCGVWLAFHSAQSPFILPDAAALTSSQPSVGTTRLTYHADARTWRIRLTRQITQAGWNVRTYSNPGAALSQWEYVSWYTRDTRFGPLVLHEHAHFLIGTNDPTLVDLRIDRSIGWRP